MTVVLDERRIICDRCGRNRTLPEGKVFFAESEIRFIFMNPVECHGAMYRGKPWKVVAVLDDLHDVCSDCVESDKRLGNFQVNRMGSRPFPIQADKQHGSSAIPWWLAEEAYKEYVRRYGTSQTLERLAERGGFGREEVLLLLRGSRK